MRRLPILAALVVGFAATLVLLAQVASDMPGHAALDSAAACTPCHATDAQGRWESRRTWPCTPFCMTCHKKDEMAKHHPVDNPVTKPPRMSLRLTQDQKSACFTCHDLANRRFDSVRWKAESLFGRMFRPEKQYRTYFLTTRNDSGQLCLACH